MRLTGAGAAQHLTYCTNIHPGESLAEVRAALAQYVLAVKAALSPSAPFGVGLRLSNAAALELGQPGELARLRDFLDAHGLYVFTLNGFPYGAFHGTRVKQRVYEPDWRSAERVAYTARLADVLAGLLPGSASGSISTVPGAWRGALSGPDDIARVREHLLQSAAYMAKLAEQGGPELSLALEPEPGCMLETLDEAADFFAAELLSEPALRRFAQLTGLTSSAAATRLPAHLGLCLDACHAAVEFEDLTSALAKLERAGVSLKKLQLSSGLRVPAFDAAAGGALAAFAEDTYLHQTVARHAGELTRYDDLPAALASAQPGAEWRVHFHVPIFLERYGVLESTQGFLRELLRAHKAGPLCQHLEVETYTWDVLPAELRAAPVTDAIVRELRFVLRELGEEAR